MGGLVGGKKGGKSKKKKSEWESGLLGGED